MGFLHRRQKVINEANGDIRIEIPASSSDGSGLDERLQSLKKVLGFTCLIFRDFDEGKTSKPRLLLAVSIMMLSGYQTAYSVYVTISLGTANIINTCLFCTCIIQTFISACFVIYWQFGGFQRIFSVSTWSKLRYSHQEPKRTRTHCCYRPIYVFFGVCLSVFVGLSVFVAVFYYTSKLHMVNVAMPFYYHVRYMLWA